MMPEDSKKNGRMSQRAFQAYLQRNPLALPLRLTDLIARGRTMAAILDR